MSQESALKAQSQQGKQLLTKMNQTVAAQVPSYTFSTSKEDVLEVAKGNGAKAVQIAFKFKIAPGEEATSLTSSIMYDYYIKHVKPEKATMVLQVTDKEFRSKNMWGWRPPQGTSGFTLLGGRTNICTITFPFIANERHNSNMEDVADVYLQPFLQDIKSLTGIAPTIVGRTSGDFEVDYDLELILKQTADVADIENKLYRLSRKTPVGLKMYVTDVEYTGRSPLLIYVTVPVSEDPDY